MAKSKKQIVSILGEKLKAAIQENSTIPEIKLNLALGRNKTYLSDCYKTGRIDLDVLTRACIIVGLNETDYITTETSVEEQSSLLAQIAALKRENEELRKQLSERTPRDNAADIEQLKRFESALEEAREENALLRERLDRNALVIRNQRLMSNIHYGFCEVVRHQMERMDAEIERIRNTDEDDTE